MKKIIFTAMSAAAMLAAFGSAQADIITAETRTFMAGHCRVERTPAADNGAPDLCNVYDTSKTPEEHIVQAVEITQGDFWQECLKLVPSHCIGGGLGDGESGGAQ